LQHAVVGYGLEVAFNCDPERFDSHKPSATSTNRVALLILDVENEEHCAGFIDNILEQVDVPILFGLGAAPERHSNEYPRWERRLFTKLQEHLGDLENIKAIGQSLDALAEERDDAVPNRIPTRITLREGRDNVERVWILGASLGGPEAVKSFLDNLPEGLPVAFVYAQHIDINFSEVLAKVLARHSTFSLRIAKEGDRLRYGEILLVPVDKEMYFDDSGIIHFKPTPWPGPYGPSIDQVLLNVADFYGSRSHAIFFSGMGNDGAIAAPLLKAYGSTIWVQESTSCANSSMPDSVNATGSSSFSGTPVQLSAELVKLIEKEELGK
jgi:chemosensory pili system protein ChpB (putative protein-glutamate methylesterase)